MNICKCHHIPRIGDFAIGKEYQWQYIIDAIRVIDENGAEISFSEINFLWYFNKA